MVGRLIDQVLSFMKMFNSDIDHIVLAVPDFDKAIDELSEKLGIRPSNGGRHLLRGTRNALLHLGNKCYLEILAVDPENNTFHGPRWMGVDLIKEPTITRWALHSPEINIKSKYLTEYDPDLGNIVDGERKTPDDKTLRWKMTLPQPTPEVDIVPFLINWTASDFHPTDMLASECTLSGFTLFDPHPQNLMSLFHNLAYNVPILKAPTQKITIQILGKNGIVEL